MKIIHAAHAATLSLAFSSLSLTALADGPTALIEMRSSPQNIRSAKAIVSREGDSRATVHISGILDGRCAGDKYSYLVTRNLAPAGGRFDIKVAILGTSLPNPNATCSNAPQAFTLTVPVNAWGRLIGRQTFSVFIGPNAQGGDIPLATFDLTNTSVPE